MSKKAPAKKGTKAQAKRTPAVDLPPYEWSSVFQAGRLKKQVYAVDPDLGCLPQKTLQLVNACSALLLRKVVHASCSAQEEEEESTKKSNGPHVLLLSAEKIQAGVKKNESLGFLTETVEEATKTEDNKLAQRKTAAKRPAAAKKASRKAERALGVSQESLDQALEVSKQESELIQGGIVMDEEDYD